jgi:hypothetical protein
MSYWPEEDQPKKETGPFDAVFADAREGGLTWPVRDRYGLMEIKGPTKILPDGWKELVRRSPQGAELVKKAAERLMEHQGFDASGPWLLVDDDELDDDAAPVGALGATEPGPASQARARRGGKRPP